MLLRSELGGCDAHTEPDTALSTTGECFRDQQFAKYNSKVWKTLLEILIETFSK